MPSSYILYVAAERREFQGLLKRVQARPLHWGLQFASEAEFNGSKVFFVADGPGMQLAGSAADVARRYVRPDVVVSTGFCGALDPDLKDGDVLIAEGVLDKENGKTYPATDPGHGGSAATGVIVSVDRVATSVAAKRELRSTGALAVEMEAAAVADRARIWNVPFYCVRAVSDTADQNFEIDFNRMRDSNGRFSRGRIIAAALAKPWSRIPDLLTLDRGCRRASESLGEFFANCRF